MIDDLMLDDDLAAETDEVDPLAPFLAEGLITEVLGEMKSGKEGTVYCCRANPSTGYDLLAAKVYRPRSHRAFKNDAIYREGVAILNKRDARAAKKKTEWGREYEFGSWMYHEYETLKRLSEAGADVPRPIRMSGNAMLMEFVGDASGAAPALQHVTLTEQEVRPLFQRALNNIELFLRVDCVHGDLSAYNILYWKGAITIIDFPQTVDPRFNPNALSLLSRDLENVSHYWHRYGVRTDANRMAQHLWGRFLRAEL